MRKPHPGSSDAPHASFRAMDNPLPNEEFELSALMRAALQKDEPAYDRLVSKLTILAKKYAINRMRRFGLKPDGSTIDDLVQEILLVVHHKKGTYDPSRQFLPWFYAIARFKLVDRFRIEQRERSLMAWGGEDGLADYKSLTYDPELGESLDLQGLLRTLTERQRLCLDLVKVQGLTCREAGELIGVSEVNTKQIVHRALKSLRAKLRPLL